MVTILCADDDQYLAELLQYALEREGFKALLAHTGRETLRVARTERVDLILLDTTLPDLSGLQVLARLRSFSRTLVIMLAGPGQGQEEDILAGFQLEADDYVIKPFNVQVLMKRIAALLRRTTTLPTTPSRHQGVYRWHDFVFDPASRELAGQGTHVTLTPTECRILHLLLLHQGRTLSEEQILQYVQGCDIHSKSGVVKTHISHLRRKMRNLPYGPQLISTVSRTGYMMPRTGYTLQRGDERLDDPVRGFSQEPAS